MCRTLAAVLGHDLDTEETAADIIAGLNAAGYLIAPFEPHECICPRCGIRHGGPPARSSFPNLHFQPTKCVGCPESSPAG
jgi:hypothetical protein